MKVMAWGMRAAFGSMLLFFLVETSYKGGKTHRGCKTGVIIAMMTGNGADIECYADRENQPVQMAVRFWIARNSQLQAIQRADYSAKVRFLLFEIAFNAVTNILGDFSASPSAFQVTAFHKMVNINSRATQK